MAVSKRHDVPSSHAPYAGNVHVVISPSYASVFVITDLTVHSDPNRVRKQNIIRHKPI